MRWTLGIETATLTAGAALLDGDVLAAELVVRTQRGHAQRLLGDIEGLLASQGIGPEDLDLVAVDVGPGSFTGIRIGVATARALVWATQSPLVGVHSLEVLAAGLPVGGALVAAVLDARKREVYGGLYRLRGPGAPPEVLLDPSVDAPGAVAARLRTAADGELVHVVGDGVRAYAEVFEGAPFAVAPPEYDALRGALVAAAGRRRALAAPLADWRALEPVYLRRSEAEIQLGPPTGESTIERR